MLLPSTTTIGHTNLLNKIESPKDIRLLHRSDLDQLAEEVGGMQIRQANESVLLIRDQIASPES